MDAAHIFRQGLGTLPPRQNQMFEYADGGFDADDFLDGDSSGQRVAHTLTACCRCRQVSLRRGAVAAPANPAIPKSRERLAAIPRYPAADLARRQVPYANTLTLPRAARSIATTLSNYKTRSAPSRPSWTATPTKTPIIPAPTRILFAQAA